MGQNKASLIDRFKAIQKLLMAGYGGPKGLPSAQAGSEREKFVRDFLQNIFPPHRRFSTGSIIDSSGHRSGQIDIAIEYGFLPSFAMPSGDRLLLAESVALVIEVKSDLSRQWKQVRRTTKCVRQLRPQLNPTMYNLDDTDDTDDSYSWPDRISVVAVGYRGYESVGRLKNRLDSTPEDERPDAALVIESGCFCGFGKSMQGPLGLYLLCIIISEVLSKVEFAAPNLLSYLPHVE